MGSLSPTRNIASIIQVLAGGLRKHLPCHTTLPCQQPFLATLPSLDNSFTLSTALLWHRLPSLSTHLCHVPFLVNISLPIPYQYVSSCLLPCRHFSPNKPPFPAHRSPPSSIPHLPLILTFIPTTTSFYLPGLIPSRHQLLFFFIFFLT